MVGAPFVGENSLASGLSGSGAVGPTDPGGGGPAGAPGNQACPYPPAQGSTGWPGEPQPLQRFVGRLLGPDTASPGLSAP